MDSLKGVEVAADDTSLLTRRNNVASACNI